MLTRSGSKGHDDNGQEGEHPSVWSRLTNRQNITSSPLCSLRNVFTLKTPTTYCTTVRMLKRICARQVLMDIALSHFHDKHTHARARAHARGAFGMHEPLSAAPLLVPVYVCTCVISLASHHQPRGMHNSARSRSICSGGARNADRNNLHRYARITYEIT